MSEKLEAMRAWFKNAERERSDLLAERAKRVKEHIEEIEEHMQKDEQGDPILFRDNRALRRMGVGGTSRRSIFSEKMAIPKRKK